MLRKRSRAVGGSSSSSSSKQGIMSEPLPLNQEKFKPNRHNPSSPASTFPKHFSPKCFSPHFDSAMSPTSILVPSPFFSDPKTTPNHPKIITPLLEPTSKGLVDALTSSDDDHNPPQYSSPISSHEAGRRRRRMVLFGSKLNIQIPSPNPPSPSPRSPIEFGFKNKDSQLALLSPAQRALRGAASAKLVVANLVVSDLELSEDYTCVIAHGPNPKTTHIFDNCIIDSCCRGRGRGGRCASASGLAGSGGLLSSCHACNKRLGQGDEIFMYRGEKAFCSSECRHQEMLLDEAMD